MCTPTYVPQNSENLFTDPRLLAMIRVDMQQINMRRTQVEGPQPLIMPSADRELQPKYAVSLMHSTQQEPTLPQNSYRLMEPKRSLADELKDLESSSTQKIPQTVSLLQSKQTSQPQIECLTHTHKAYEDESVYDGEMLGN